MAFSGVADHDVVAHAPASPAAMSTSATLWPCGTWSHQRQARGEHGARRQAAVVGDDRDVVALVHADVRAARAAASVGVCGNGTASDIGQSLCRARPLSHPPSGVPMTLSRRTFAAACAGAIAAAGLQPGQVAVEADHLPRSVPGRRHHRHPRPPDRPEARHGARHDGRRSTTRAAPAAASARRSPRAPRPTATPSWAARSARTRSTSACIRRSATTRSSRSSR